MMMRVEGERTTKVYNNLFFLLDKIHYLHDVLTYEVWQGKIFDDKISIIRWIQSISNFYTKMLLFFFLTQKSSTRHFDDSVIPYFVQHRAKTRIVELNFKEKECERTYNEGSLDS